MKKITLQHVNNIIEKGTDGEFAHVIITSNSYDVYIEMVGPGKDIKSTVYWYKALIDIEEQIKIKVDDVDEDSEYILYEEEGVDNLSIEDMLEKSTIRTDKMLGFQLAHQNKMIFVPFQKDRILSITATHYRDRVELNFGGMDKTPDGQFISKTWLHTEFEDGEEITVSIVSVAEPIEEHIFLPQKNCKKQNENC
jgi:hypothetical protein